MNSIRSYQTEKVIIKALLDDIVKSMQLLLNSNASKSASVNTTEENIFGNSKELNTFCMKLEAVFCHGLKDKSGFFSGPKDYWNYIETLAKNPPINTTAKNLVDSIVKMTNIRTAKGKGRAWIQLCLMERTLEQFTRTLIQNAALTREWYEEWAVFRTREEKEIFLGALAPLNVVTFTLVVSSVDFDNLNQHVIRLPAEEESSLDGIDAEPKTEPPKTGELQELISFNNIPEEKSKNNDTAKNKKIKDINSKQRSSSNDLYEMDIPTSRQQSSASLLAAPTDYEELKKTFESLQKQYQNKKNENEDLKNQLIDAVRTASEVKKNNQIDIEAQVRKITEQIENNKNDLKQELENKKIELQSLGMALELKAKEAEDIKLNLTSTITEKNELNSKLSLLLEEVKNNSSKSTSQETTTQKELEKNRYELLQLKELLETEKLKLNQEIQKHQIIIEEKDALFNNAQATWNADKKRTDSELNELQKQAHEQQHLTEQLKQKDIEVTQSQEQRANEIHVQLREKNTEISKLNEKYIETESNLKEVTKKLEHSQRQTEAQITQLQEKDTYIKEIRVQKEQLENTQLSSNEQVKLLNETIQNQTSALEQFKIDLEKTGQKNNTNRKY